VDGSHTRSVSHRRDSLSFLWSCREQAVLLLKGIGAAGDPLSTWALIYRPGRQHESGDAELPLVRKCHGAFGMKPTGV